MCDTELWNEESDNYTQRSIDKYGKEYLYHNKDKVEQAKVIEECLKRHIIQPQSILDIGCSYGGLSFELSNLCPTAKIVGIDPGENSIKMANLKNSDQENITFQIGHSHKLKCKDEQFDFIVLSMVLQWVPRSLLFLTISEIDRTLKPGGYIFLSEFLPDHPIQSKSIHNESISIFKNDYAKFFTVFPWYIERFRQIYRDSLGQHYRQYHSLLEKIPLDRAYKNVIGVSEQK